MNKKGQLISVMFMLTLTIIILALALAPAIKEQIDTGRTSMDCDNDSISTYDKAGCLVSDLTLFQFVGGLIFIGGAILTAKVML